eukprot:GEZU01032426.1.p1 GENE.GEZU01032426.1~~GEZU01032426.1.p1  ORF type:complete len:284 (-),score=100.75 GEZU01032426.1:143-994(-)
MDITLDIIDPLFVDKIYESMTFFPALQQRDYWLRQYLTIYFLWLIGGYVMYFLFAGLSWLFFFDKKLRQHKNFLPNQELQEIAVSLFSIPIMAFPSALIFLGEVRGYSMLYDGFTAYGGIPYIIFSIALYLVFTDTLIFWIHKWLHLPIFYAPIHKLHHKWIISTPFASHAFHPIDGFSQSIPYHIFVYLFPLNKWVYLGLFVFVNFWTISIHDNDSFYEGSILNGAAHHTIHHRQFNYNYGQYFTFWDKICGTHKLPARDLNTIKVTPDPSDKKGDNKQKGN